MEFTKEQLDFTKVENRKAFIMYIESGHYDGLHVDGNGRLAIVEVTKGESMIVKVLNDKDWWECIEYGKNGYAQCDWVER